MISAARRLLLLSMAATLFLPTATEAQAVSRTTVEVVHAGDDPVGQRVAAALRMAISESDAYALAHGDEHVVRINIVSLDAVGAGGKAGVRSALSVVYTMSNYLPLDRGNPQTWYPIFLTSAIRLVGSEKADAVARDMLSTLEQEMREFRAASSQQ